jgi:hypothetical protein
MASNGNGQNIVGAQDMAGLGNLCAVQAYLARLDQFGGHRTLLHDPGKPEPLIQALRQFFLPVI